MSQKNQFTPASRDEIRAEKAYVTTGSNDYKVSFDILAGLDFAFCLESNENGKATAIGKDYVTGGISMPKPSIDFRPRIQLKAGIKKFGFLAGYSSGLTNYQNKYNLKAYSSFLQLGFSYLLK